MKKGYFFSLFILAALLFTCNKETILADGKELELELGYTVSFNGDDFQIHFDELLEDSRCPFNSLCQWEGRASVSVIAIANGSEKEFIFSSFAPENMDTVFVTRHNSYQFELLEINPNPSVANGDLEAANNIKFVLKELN